MLQNSLKKAVHTGAFCQFLFQWIYYYGSNKSKVNWQNAPLCSGPLAIVVYRVWICSNMIYQAAKLCEDFLFVSGKLLVDFGYQPSDEIYRSIVFTFLSNVFSTIIGLPCSIYSTFVLAEKHGFNQQTAVFYIKDQIKKFLISQVIS